MFGLFKKKETRKTVEKSKGFQKEPRKFESINKGEKNTNSKKSQKLFTQARVETEGQFLQKRKIKNPHSSIIRQEILHRNQIIQTPKILNKTNLKYLEQKDTQKVHQLFTQPQQLNPHRVSRKSHQASICRRYQSIEQVVRKKEIINLQSVKGMLQQWKNIIENQSEILISRDWNNNLSFEQFKQIHLKLFYNKYFRFYSPKSLNEIIQRYGEILQGLQLLISKLRNRVGKGIHFHKQQDLNQQKLEKIYIQNEEEFLLFFKHFFSKPYTLCDRASIRKIIQILWESHLFKIDQPNKLYQQLKLWIYGLSLPTNPSLIVLHKLVFTDPENIPKYAKMIFNHKIYLGINETDPLIKTPFLIAAQLQNKKAIEKLIKSGADPYLSPYYTSKGKYSYQYSQDKSKKHNFSISFPQFSKKLLSPMETLLFLKQDFNLLADTLYMIQLTNIRKLKKQSEKIRNALEEIPDCTFQIAWKTYRNILSFKELPADVITVYKTGNKLRLDYNIDSIQKPVKGKHYTILIKTERGKPLEYYEIRHHSKTIINRMAQIDLNIVKQKLNEFCSYPQARNSEHHHCKGFVQNKQRRIRVEMSLLMQNQFISPQIKNKENLKQSVLKNVKQYQKAIIQSEVIDYKQIQKSQIQTVCQQTAVNEKLLPYKLKSKLQKSNVQVEIEFYQEEQLKLKHFQFIMSLFKADSVLIHKIMKIMSLFENQDIFRGFDLFNCLPILSKLSFQNDFTIQMSIKNLNYISMSNNLFNVQLKVLQQDYEQNINPRILDSLLSTVVMSQRQSINVSQFLGKTEKLLELEDEQAKKKFEQILASSFTKEKSHVILDDLIMQDDD